LLLGVRPMGDWSILMTLSSFSSPSISSCLPALVLALFSSFARRLYRISLMRELLPLPLTPVTQVNTPSGISTSMFFRLFSAAPLMTNLWSCTNGLRSFGTSIFLRPLRYAPVTERSTAIISSTLPAATISPPPRPAPGPISTTKSAARMVSSSCSTTIRELPISRRCFNVASSLSLSR